MYHGNGVCKLLTGTTLLIVFALSSGAALAKSKERVLHAFDGSDGAYPDATLTLDSKGNLYGTASNGGDSNKGSVFKRAADGTFTILYSFSGGSDGQTPGGGVTINPDNGDLYGTATFGGAGNGVLYKLSAKGKFTVLHSFDGANDGTSPVGNLLRDKKGNLYGLASFGGVNDDGTAFEYSAKGKFTVLHSFSGSDGLFPLGSLRQGDDGALYGVAEFGGANNDGTVFSLSPKGKFKTLYSFSGGNDGAYPYGGLALDSAGNIYGTTVMGGSSSSGTLFTLSSKGKKKVLYSFSGGASDGAFPQGDLLATDKGDLYGVAESGGASNYGSVYKFSPADGFTLLYSFKNGTDGAFPYAGVIQGSASTLYGTTYVGGGNTCPENTCGTVFSLKAK